MSKKMQNAPVYFTVAQIRFNPILNMEGYLPTIQEKMRVARFPDFRRESIQRIILALQSDANQPTPSFVPQARCRFGDIESTTEFVLDNNMLALQTTSYDTSETFFKVLLEGLSIIHETLNLDFTERIGLRYFDAVLLKPNENISDYLTQEVLGLSSKIGDKLLHSYSETSTINTSGQLVSRVVIQDGHVGLPPEIMPYAPRINVKFTNPEGRHAILDTDAFYEQREAFNLDKIKSRLEALHVEIDKSFKSTITSFALKQWE